MAIMYIKSILFLDFHKDSVSALYGFELNAFNSLSFLLKSRFTRLKFDVLAIQNASPLEACRGEKNLLSEVPLQTHSGSYRTLEVKAPKVFPVFGKASQQLTED